MRCNATIKYYWGFVEMICVLYTKYMYRIRVRIAQCEGSWTPSGQRGSGGLSTMPSMTALNCSDLGIAALTDFVSRLVSGIANKVRKQTRDPIPVHLTPFAPLPPPRGIKTMYTAERHAPPRHAVTMLKPEKKYGKGNHVEEAPPLSVLRPSPCRSPWRSLGAPPHRRLSSPEAPRSAPRPPRARC